jgi:hypothetical protein
VSRSDLEFLNRGGGVICDVGWVTSEYGGDGGISVSVVVISNFAVKFQSIS